jgi:hypothetical protein
MTDTTAPKPSFFSKVEAFFHTAEVDVSGAFVKLVGQAQAKAFATGVEAIVKTDLGKIAVAAVKAAEGLASGAEKQAAAFAQITTQAQASGIDVETSVVNMLIELAVQMVKGTFGVAL